VAALVAVAPSSVHAVTIEPDNYPAGTTLTNIDPSVRLVTQTPIGPDTFDITSAEGDSAIHDLSPTGTRVFAHVGIPFFLDTRKLRAEFNGLTSSVSFAFAGSSSTAQGDVGRLEAYGTNGALLTFDETAPLFAGQFETLSVARPTPDIAYTLAYTSVGSFGRLDAMTFAQPVPEPGGAALAALAAALLSRRARNGAAKTQRSKNPKIK
jgi:hypothetical protein